MSTHRSKTRFQAESLAAYYITEDSETFHAIVINESYTGACLVARNDGALKSQSKIKAKVGKMDEMEAKVVWIEELDSDVIKFGIEYLK